MLGRLRFKIGDFVWVAPKGVYVFKQPKRISGFDKYHDGSVWAFLEGEKTAVSVDDLIPVVEQTPPPPNDAWAPGVRAANVPPVEGGGPNPPEDWSDDFGAASAPLLSNKSDISRHLYALFPPAFVTTIPMPGSRLRSPSRRAESLTRPSTFPHSNSTRQLRSRSRRTRPGSISTLARRCGTARHRPNQKAERAARTS